MFRIGCYAWLIRHCSQTSPRALRSFETPVCTYQSKKHDVLEHLNIQQHLCEILISRDSALSELHLVQVWMLFI